MVNANARNFTTRLPSVLSQVTLRDVERDEAICRQGDEATDLYLLVEGAVSVYVEGGDPLKEEMAWSVPASLTALRKRYDERMTAVASGRMTGTTPLNPTNSAYPRHTNVQNIGQTSRSSLMNNVGRQMSNGSFGGSFRDSDDGTEDGPKSGSRRMSVTIMATLKPTKQQKKRLSDGQRAMFRGVFHSAELRYLQSAFRKWIMHLEASGLVADLQTTYGRLVNVLNSGCAFGTYGLKHARRSATIIARERCELICIPKEAAHRILFPLGDTISFYPHELASKLAALEAAESDRGDTEDPFGGSKRRAGSMSSELTSRRRHLLDLVLRPLAIIQTLEPATRESLFEVMRSRHFKRGESIYSYGEPARFAVLVVQGTVSLEDSSGSLLDTPRAGDIFGYLPMLLDTGRPARRLMSAHAVTPCLCVLIDRGDYLRLWHGAGLDKDEFVRVKLLRRLRDEFGFLPKQLPTIFFNSQRRELPRGSCLVAREMIESSITFIDKGEGQLVIWMSKQLPFAPGSNPADGSELPVRVMSPAALRDAQPIANVGNGAVFGALGVQVPSVLLNLEAHDALKEFAKADDFDQSTAATDTQKVKRSTLAKLVLRCTTNVSLIEVPRRLLAHYPDVLDRLATNLSAVVEWGVSSKTAAMDSRAERRVRQIKLMQEQHEAGIDPTSPAATRRPNAAGATVGTQPDPATGAVDRSLRPSQGGSVADSLDPCLLRPAEQTWRVQKGASSHKIETPSLRATEHRKWNTPFSSSAIPPASVRASVQYYRMLEGRPVAPEFHRSVAPLIERPASMAETGRARQAVCPSKRSEQYANRFQVVSQRLPTSPTPPVMRYGSTNRKRHLGVVRRIVAQTPPPSFS